MNTKYYIFLLAAVVAVLSVPVPAEVELPLPAEKGAVLNGRVDTSLAGIKELYICIVQSDSESGTGGLVREGLRVAVESRLEDAGVKYVKSRSLTAPELRVYIDILKLPDSGKHVFHIQTSLARAVTVPAQRNLQLQVDVWKTKSFMDVTLDENMSQRVTDVVEGQIETFIDAFLAANPVNDKPSDVNETAVNPKQDGKGTAEPAAEYLCIASKNSGVFHRPGCRWAQNVSQDNLVTYKSRDEAISAGKRPCKLCNP